jgi:hypothetical protein
VGGVLASGRRAPEGTVVITGGALVIGLVLGVRFWRRRWAILDVPTSKCVAVFAGRNEVSWAAGTGCRSGPFDPQHEGTDLRSCEGKWTSPRG